MPGDVYTFVKQEPSLPPSSTHGYSAQSDRAMPPKAVPTGHVYPTALTACEFVACETNYLYVISLPAAPAIVSSTTVVGHDPLNPFPGGKKKKVSLLSPHTVASLS